MEWNYPALFLKTIRKKDCCMKVGIVGSGYIANVHAKALAGLDVELVGVVDQNLEHAQAFAKKFHIAKAFDQITSLFEEGVECVHICTPPTSHYDLVKTCFEHGVFVICEKPLTLDVQEAKELVELANEKHLLTAVNFNNRYYDAIDRMKTIVQSEEFGDVLIIHGSYQQQFHLLPTAYSWRYEDRVAGKLRASSEIGSHWIDLATYVTGKKIVEVSATFGNFYPVRYIKDGIMHEENEAGSLPVRVNSEDSASITFRFEDGSLGNLFLSEISHGKINELVLEVNGKYQSVCFNSEFPYQIQTSCGKGMITNTNAFAGGFEETFASFFEEVYSAFLKNEKPERAASFQDAYYNVAVTQAMYESNKQNGMFVKVEL